MSHRSRLFFFPNRSLPDPSLNEFRERNSHVSITLSLKLSFGGAGKAVAGGGGVASPS